MPLPDLYPPARPKLDGVGQGIWSTIGEWKILLHTTETRGVPGYQAGQLAPHVTYWPKYRTWTQHFKFSRPSEALVGFDNDMVIQVEMICYSDRNVAVSVGGLWVGDLTDDQLRDVTTFCRWVMGHVQVQPVWPERQAFSYSQANAPGFRFTASQFHAFNGILGHQHAPPGNVHWDPGAFPWVRFMALLQPQQGAEEMFAPDGWITIDESLVRHASTQGWYKKPDGTPDFSAGTLNYYLTNLANGNLMDPAWGDYANWRRAVANGIARADSSGIAPGELVRIQRP